jgi:hypothetical protein
MLPRAAWFGVRLRQIEPTHPKHAADFGGIE